MAKGRISARATRGESREKQNLAEATGLTRAQVESAADEILNHSARWGYLSRWYSRLRSTAAETI